MSEVELRPVERMALTVALSRDARGIDIQPNTAAVLAWTLDRLVNGVDHGI